MSNATKDSKMYYRGLVTSISLIGCDVFLYGTSRYSVEYVGSIIDSMQLKAFWKFWLLNHAMDHIKDGVVNPFS